MAYKVYLYIATFNLSNMQNRQYFSGQISTYSLSSAASGKNNRHIRDVSLTDTGTSKGIRSAGFLVLFDDIVSLDS